MRFKDPLPRFYSRIHKADNGCWLWTGASVQGRGQISVNGRTILATRFAYEHFKEPIPAGMFVCHTCDVPACVNPDHLWLGTARDNVQDALKKNRLPQSAKRGVCIYGHAFDGRDCPTCKTLRNRARDYRSERQEAKQKRHAEMARLQSRVAELEAALREARDALADCMNHATFSALMEIYHAELERIDKLLEKQP